jgi:protein-disulfide isomerase
VINEIVLAKPVYYVFYQFPFLDDTINTKDSDQAALAAECAAEQNLFWDFKNLLYKNMKPVSGEFSAGNLENYARIAGLDMSAYNACYDEKRYQDKIDQDLALGEQMGVSGTPTVYVNGVDVAPGRVPTFEEINALVEQALAGTLSQPTPAIVTTPYPLWGCAEQPHTFHIRYSLIALVFLPAA